MYAEHMPSVVVENTYKRTEAFVDYIKENTNITIVFPQDELKAAKPYWRVYYKYDTHWNKAGAFIGTQALYKELGILTKDRDKWKESIPYVASLLSHESVKIQAKALWLLGEIGLVYPLVIQDVVPGNG